jgi:hypothetical protein
MGFARDSRGAGAQLARCSRAFWGRSERAKTPFRDLKQIVSEN